MSNTDLLSNGAATGAAGADAGAGSTTEAPTPRSESAEKAQTSGANGGTPKRRAGLTGMVLAELRELAGQLGIPGTAGMRKGDLIAAIKERQGGSGAAAADTLPLGGIEDRGRSAGTRSSRPAKAQAPSAKPAESRSEQPAEVKAEGAAQETAETDGDTGRREGSRRRRGASRPAGSPSERTATEEGRTRTEERERSGGQGNRQQDNRSDRSEGRQDRSDRSEGRQQDSRHQDSRHQDRQQDDDDDDRGGRRGRRFRDRRRRGSGSGRAEGGNNDTEIREDDVLLPVAGVLDVLENYAFVRTSGYLAGPNDVYVSLSLVRKYGLRRGDAITGLVRQPREGEQQRQKFNPLVRVESINGLDPDAAKSRPEFTKLTPLYPNERLRLETEPHVLTTRVIDLVMPVGKGQRALIVSPPKAGKTSVLQAIANAITTNNPECYLMVVLVDERPEEVTDMQRSVKGEVIASTFDRPPSDHTTVAELSIERAKRLVEMGHDVVVLLDSITRLGRAYNLAAPASGRILSGGVDSTALFPPKRFLGAARNIEGGGSLTIFATALVETGSAGDMVIFEEFKGTGNAELKLDRKIADKRIFPAVDVDPSGTRKEELLLSPDELAVTVKLRRVLHALDSQAAIELLLDRLRKSRTNIEFLMQVAKTTPAMNDD
ncbi:MAG TPA: transcription termination factor Rho [Actinophytocola sp.]|uniref:transcription termination factor Rho n=1 Tax=Actinophytocola sp. TaxID=1872138 RepID=UPI002DBD8615|nr:transcription termination factor Rho [Actinophytocola sp.]HEU5470008.1 transcription termination factor Rho [Actinophytocola sp.]